MNEKINMERYHSNLNKKNIVVTSNNWNTLGMPHFVHTMEYFYFALDIILNNLNSFIIIIEPKVEYKSKYVSSYIELLYKYANNFIFVKDYKGIIHQYHIFHHFCGITNIDNANQYGLKLYEDFFFLESNTKKKDYYYQWFEHLHTSELLYNLISSEHVIFNDLKIGLINRKNENGRHILNELEICKLIRTNFDIDIDVEYFEDKSFIEQINFFKTHNVIISSHGAQLVSIPFMKKNSLVIECCHEEHHPYYYFPGLSYTSNKYHVMLCDNHKVFPKWKSPQYEKYNVQLKSNMNINCNKLIDIIKLYKDNHFNLPEKVCYLY